MATILYNFAQNILKTHALGFKYLPRFELIGFQTTGTCGGHEI
jgi:hypothetical protein